MLPTILALAVTLLPVPAPVDPTYAALRALAPDGRQVAVTRPLRFDRDVFRFEFESGTFHLLTPVAGRTVGAVFVGEGRYKLLPACEDERRHLAFVLGDKGLESLTERFSTLMLWFGDGTAEELARLGEPRVAAPDPRAGEVVETYFERQKKDIRINLLLRVLSDLLDTPGATNGVFYAVADGGKLPLSLVTVDPRGVEASRLGDGGETSALWVFDSIKGGAWYQCSSRELADVGEPPSYLPRVDAHHYTIDTTVESKTRIRGTTTVDFAVLAPVRVVPLRLLGNLRISSAELRLPGAEEWMQVAFIQEEEDNYRNSLPEDSDPAVVLPEILSAGTLASLRLHYAGDQVLQDRGGGTFAIDARDSWYPNLGVFTDTATFDLTYRVPQGQQVVSVGQLQSLRREGGHEVTEWRETNRIGVAGFNYGRFQKLERVDDEVGIRLEVYTDTGVPDVIRELNQSLKEQALGEGSLVGERPSESSGGSGGGAGPQSIGKLKGAELAESALADAMNQLRVGTAYFGPLPNRAVAITQQSFWSFGQSWPSLVFLPYLSFLTGTQRNNLNMKVGAMEFVDLVGFHEVAHQWWGHHVNPASYRDEWIAEGFAVFSAALTAQHTVGWPQYAEIWRQNRDYLVKPYLSPVPVHEVGPITRGRRLSNYRAPDAGYMIYAKGGFVLHMLRMLMREDSNDPDAGFITLMKDFVATHGGRNVTTADFAAMVQKHFNPNLDAAGNGKIDWFFDQWVYGTEVPKIGPKLKAERLSKDEYRITGKVRVSEVGEGFLVRVPLYAELQDGSIGRFGHLDFRGPGEQEVDQKILLPQVPRRILANAMLDVLAKE